MSILTPTYKVENVTKISKEILAGKKYIILDIDNTLFLPESIDTKPEIIKWFKTLNKRYTCYCISNSFTIKKRKKEIEKTLGCTFHISKNKKPSKALVKEILSLGLVPEETLVIGDMRLTDIWFGNRLGAQTVLVSPLDKEKLLRITVARKIENFLSNFIN